MDRLAQARAPGVISLATAHPAPETFPLADFSRAMQRTFADDPPESMQYRANTGDPDLCATLAESLVARGCDAHADEIIVTSGAQQAADLIASVLLADRAVVASESPTYPGTLGVFDARGASYVEVRSDADGVRIDDVERVFAEYRPRLFTICPIAENPTGLVLPARRGKAIVELARRYDVVVLEDQTGWTFTYDEPAPPPLAAYDTDGRVVMMESLSKSIFPALRIGYLRVKGTMRDSIEAAKVRTDSFTSTLTQRALWRFLRGAGLPAPPQERARALPPPARPVRRRAGARAALGRRAPAAGRHQRLAAAAGAPLDPGGVRGLRARGRARHAGRPALPQPQRPGRAAALVRRPRRRGAARSGGRGWAGRWARRADSAKAEPNAGGRVDPSSHRARRPNRARSLCRAPRRRPSPAGAGSRPARSAYAAPAGNLPAGHSLRGGTPFDAVLPSGRVVRPAGRSVLTGMNALGVALTPDGRFAVVGNDDEREGKVHSLTDPSATGGYSLAVVDTAGMTVVSRYAAPPDEKYWVGLLAVADPAHAGRTLVLAAGGPDQQGLRVRPRRAGPADPRRAPRDRDPGPDRSGLRRPQPQLSRHARARARRPARLRRRRGRRRGRDDRPGDPHGERRAAAGRVLSVRRDAGGQPAPGHRRGADALREPAPAGRRAAVPHPAGRPAARLGAVVPRTSARTARSSASADAAAPLAPAAIALDPAPDGLRTVGGAHPTAVAATPDGAYAYVAMTNVDRIATVALSGVPHVVGGTELRLFDRGPYGTQPAALALSHDGARLYVALAGLNAVAVIDARDPAHLHRLGLIPTGWYPTALALAADDRTLFVANTKGFGHEANFTGDPATDADSNATWSTLRADRSGPAAARERDPRDAGEHAPHRHRRAALPQGHHQRRRRARGEQDVRRDAGRSGAAVRRSGAGLVRPRGDAESARARASATRWRPTSSPTPRSPTPGTSSSPAAWRRCTPSARSSTRAAAARWSTRTRTPRTTRAWATSSTRCSGAGCRTATTATWCASRATTRAARPIPKTDDPNFAGPDDTSAPTSNLGGLYSRRRARAGRAGGSRRLELSRAGTCASATSGARTSSCATTARWSRPAGSRATPTSGCRPTTPGPGPTSRRCPRKSPTATARWARSCSTSRTCRRGGTPRCS